MPFVLVQAGNRVTDRERRGIWRRIGTCRTGQPGWPTFKWFLLEIKPARMVALWVML